MTDSAGGESIKVDFRVERWLVEPQLNQISADDQIFRVEPKVMQVLECMAERPGKTITKEVFMERVWSDTIVTDDVLARCISELRKVFGDNARKPRFIETIRKSGYRLIASITLVREGIDVQPVEETAQRMLPGRIDVVYGGLRWPRDEMVVPFQHYLHQPLAWGSTLALLVVVGLIWLRHALPDEVVEPPKTVPFTSFPGEEYDPALSPNGNQVAFVWNGGASENFDIYIKQTGAETPLQITNSAAAESNPAWSPDGRYLAFVRTEEETGSGIYIVPAIGGSERNVASLGPGEIRGLVWSPDGNTLALSAQGAQHEAFSIFLLSVTTLEKWQVTAPPTSYRGDMEPAFSPDGKQLAFTRSVVDEVRDIYMVPVEGGEPRQLTFDNMEITGLDWTPDGNSIIFASNRGGQSNLWKVTASGGTPEWIAAAGEGSSVYKPSIARHAMPNRLTYAQRTFDTNIWELKRSGTYGILPPEQLITSTRWDSNPDISPDGSRVAFASKRSGNYEIWVYDRSDATPVRLTFFEGPFTATPRWSPDGKYIAFVSLQEERADIYVIDAQGGVPRRLTTQSSDDITPSWSHDGTGVYFASNRSGSWQIWKIPFEGGKATQVTVDGGFAAFEGKDGGQLYYVKNDTSGVWKMPVMGGASTRIVDALDPYDWGNWTVMEHGIYFIRRDEVGPVIAYHNFETGRTRRVALLDNVPKHPSFSVSREEDWFLVTQVDRKESDILLVEDFR